jgi:hypothetical protein
LLLSLQRSAGNRAVAALVQRARIVEPTKPPGLPRGLGWRTRVEKLEKDGRWMNERLGDIKDEVGEIKNDVDFLNEKVFHSAGRK